LPDEVNSYADSLISNHEPEFLPWINKQIELQLLKPNYDMVALFCNKKAEFFRIRGKYDEAISAISTALNQKAKLDNLISGECYTILGKTYAGRGDYEKSAFYFIESLKNMEKAGHKMGMAFALNNIGIVYDLQKNYTKALEYYLRSVKIKAQLKDSAGLAAGYNNIGITYFNLEDLPQALDYHLKAYKLNILLGREESVGRSLNNLGLTSLKNNQNEKALEYFRESLGIRNKYKNAKDIGTTCNNLGKAYLQLKLVDSANYYNQLALNQAQSIQAYALLKDVYGLQSDLFVQKGNLKEALKSKDLMIMYNDSLINEENIKSIAEFESKYQHEKMRRTISDKNLLVAQKNEKIKAQQVWVLIWSGLALLLLVSILFLTYLYYQNHLKKTMFKAQIILLEERKTTQENNIRSINSQLSELSISLAEKEKLLQTFYASGSNDVLPPELLSLSERETEVLSYLALGWSDQEIADKLFLSKATIKTHLRRIYAKLLVRGRSEAVSIAHRYKIIGFAVENSTVQ